MALLATMPMAAVQLPSVAPGLPRQPISGATTAEPGREPARDLTGAPNADVGNGAGKPQLFSSPLTPMRLAAVSDNPASISDTTPDANDAPPIVDDEPTVDESADGDAVIATAPVSDFASASAPYEIPDLFADEVTEAMPVTVADATPDAIPAEATDATATDAMAADTTPDESPDLALAAADEGDNGEDVE